MAQRLATKNTRPKTGKVTVTHMPIDDAHLELLDTKVETENNAIELDEATATDIDFSVITEDDADGDEDIVTPKQMAARLGTDPKSFRRWLRTYTNDRAGKGGRWKLTTATADALAEAYHNRNKKGTEPTLPDAD